MSEAEFDVDKAEAEYEAARADAGDDPDDGGDGGGDDGNKGDDPPGFKSYEAYVADGGDPDQYVGKQAYEDRYANIQENKRLRKDVKGLQGTVQQTMDAVNTWQETERKKMRTELDQKLEKAKEDEDLDGALATQKEIDDLDDEPDPPAPTHQDEHPVIADFREANPLLDPDSDDYNEEFNDDVEAIYNSLYQQLTYSGRKKATDGQIKRCLKRAMNEAKQLHEMDEAPDGNRDNNRGESRRNKRASRQQRTNRRSTQTTTTPKAEAYVIDNPRNARQANAAPEVRDMIHKKAYEHAIKGGKSEDDAKKYADGESQRFEASLAK